MGKKIEALLRGEGENYILPFFWQHGEPEEKLREYMGVIQEAHCNAVCVESRPHPDFMGDKWWKDMDVILDEARKRGMRVWILDDSHFPTGYANGAALKASKELRRQSIYTKSYHVEKKKKLTVRISRIIKKLPTSLIGKMTAEHYNKGIKFDDDSVLSVTALTDGQSIPIPASYRIEGDRVDIAVPDGARKVYVTILTRNAGIHRSYINMMDEASCRILIDAVYEPHYRHYRDDFGKTIAGFFSDEPELGNGVCFNNDITVGTDYDLPWSGRIAEILPEKLGKHWKQLLPMIHSNDFDEDATAYVRLCYMDTVTRLVENCFSKQIGNWCGEHGVEYIGHIIEDNNQHARTGASLGHYFRGLSGQHMAGIDDIGGQVVPYREDDSAEGILKLLGGRDGEFYHFMLGALGASAAAIDPVKQGRCMCEIFGNYGWCEGPRLEKYLADHFMVQGVNYFVPHAFSPKEYPDRDCPPHFYANGHNPQYRAFGSVMAYMNRICALISDGKPVVHTAVLYHGEQEWMGKTMLDQKIMRILMEKQIYAHIIPCDVFIEPERYSAIIDQKGLHVNGNRYTVFIIPTTAYINAALANGIIALKDSGTAVYFVESYPGKVIGDPGKNLTEEQAASLLEQVKGICRIAALDSVAETVEREAVIQPGNARIRYFHYKGEEEIYYIVNEDDKPYIGTVALGTSSPLYCYNAWNNVAESVKMEVKDERAIVPVHLRSGESLILVAGERENLAQRSEGLKGRKTDIGAGVLKWKQSVCKAIDYPAFSSLGEIKSFVPYSDAHSGFSGFIAYETVIPAGMTADENARYFIEIEDAGEDVEVFVNNRSLGIQVISPFYYDITDSLKTTDNFLRIEVATSLERERGANKKKQMPTGIIGGTHLIKTGSVQVS